MTRSFIPLPASLLFPLFLLSVKCLRGPLTRSPRLLEATTMVGSEFNERQPVAWRRLNAKRIKLSYITLGGSRYRLQSSFLRLRRSILNQTAGGSSLAPSPVQFEVMRDHFGASESTTTNDDPQMHSLTDWGQSSRQI